MKRKHYTQFTKNEKQIVKKKQCKAFVKGFAKHAIERMEEREVKEYFNEYDFYKTVREGYVIEVSERPKNDIRMLVRSKDAKHGKNLVLSYSFKYQKIITCWVNDSNDNHATINMKIYDKTMDVTACF